MVDDGPVQEVAAHLGISFVGALSVVISSAVLYLCLTAVLRVYGHQLLGGVSTFSLAVTTLLGAIAARAALGDSPTMAGGLVAIGTLLVLERLMGRLAQLLPALGLAHRSPALLMIGDQVCPDELRRSGIDRQELWSLLRQRGITNREQVRLVVLEDRGALTVIPAGEPIDPAFLADVRGVDQVPREWLRSSDEA